MIIPLPQWEDSLSFGTRKFFCPSSKGRGVFVIVVVLFIYLSLVFSSGSCHESSPGPWGKRVYFFSSYIVFCSIEEKNQIAKSVVVPRACPCGKHSSASSLSL